MTNYERVEAILDEKNIDAILVSDGYNMRYISGFTGATGYLFISKNVRKLFTDSRYTVAAKAQAPDFDVEIVDGGRNYAALINNAIEADGVKKLGFEANNFSYAQYESFKKSLKAKELVPVGNDLSLLRVKKTEEEIANLRQAEHIGDIAFNEILSHIKPGVTELEIAAKIEYIMKCNGAEKLSFETIVAAGINGSKPHAEPGNYKIQSGDLVTMDFGCVYNGYCSDMTRTVCVGKANAKQREIYDIVLKAQTAVIDTLKPGMKGKEYDKIARDIIADAGYGEYFGHGLGHSVGLEIHEDPRFSVSEERIIEAGTIITVEPGIYIPDFGGVRIEDMLVLTEDGCEDFAHSRKDLIEL
jgi:Xaa-Pro aminopeptidase